MICVITKGLDCRESPRK